MKSISKLTALLLVLTMCFGFSSCNDDNKNGIQIPDDVLFDFVTVVSTGDKGTVFEFRKNGDSSLITLTAGVQLDDKKVKPGMRVIIQYVPSGGQQAYQSGPITLYGIAMIANGKAEITSLENIDAIDGGPMKMHTISRSGQYVDVWIEASYINAPVTLGIYVDEATIDDAYPTAYLKFVPDRNSLEQRPSQLYGSFDIKEVLDRPTSKGIIINYTNGSSNDQIRFDKDNREPLLPTE